MLKVVGLRVSAPWLSISSTWICFSNQVKRLKIIFQSTCSNGECGCSSLSEFDVSPLNRKSLQLLSHSQNCFKLLRIKPPAHWSKIYIFWIYIIIYYLLISLKMLGLNLVELRVWLTCLNGGPTVVAVSEEVKLSLFTSYVKKWEVCVGVREREGPLRPHPLFIQSEASLQCFL